MRLGLKITITPLTPISPLTSHGIAPERTIIEQMHDFEATAEHQDFDISSIGGRTSLVQMNILGSKQELELGI